MSDFLATCYLRIYLCSASEGHPKVLQQRLRLFIGLSSRVYGYIKAPDLVYLVILDLGEYNLFFYAYGVVAHAVEGAGRHAHELHYPGHGETYEAVEELEHLGPAESDHAAYRHAGAELEGRYGLLRLGHDRLLAGYGRKVARCRVDELHILYRFGETDVEGYLFELGNLHDAGVAELLHHSRDDFFREFFLEPWNHLPSTSPHFLQALTLRSPSRILPTLTGPLHLPHRIITLEACIGASFSIMPPCLYFAEGFWWRLTML